MGGSLGKPGFILSILAALLVLEGIPYFGFPGAVKRWALTLQDIPENTLRVMGLVITLIGLMILIALRYG